MCSTLFPVVQQDLAGLVITDDLELEAGYQRTWNYSSRIDVFMIHNFMNFEGNAGHASCIPQLLSFLYIIMLSYVFYIMLSFSKLLQC